MKILLADPSEVWCDALEDQLKCDHTVIRCNDGREVLQLLNEHKPDAMVLGLDLPYIDGLTLLQLIHASGMPVRILVAATYYNDYILAVLSQFKIGYALTKPCTVCSAMTQIYQLLHFEEGKTHKNDPDAVLLALGLRMNLSGYKYVRAAIEMLRKENGKALTKALYPDVAKCCGGTHQSVERAMRTVIRDAWMHRDDRIWCAYFPKDRQGRIECPSNGNFITRIAFGGNDNRACG